MQSIRATIDFRLTARRQEYSKTNFSSCKLLAIKLPFHWLKLSKNHVKAENRNNNWRIYESRGTIRKPLKLGVEGHYRPLSCGRLHRFRMHQCGADLKKKEATRLQKD